MEDDYLPLYEVVDDDNTDNPNGIANNSAYERLVNDANSVQEEYQLPQSDTSYVRYPAYSEIATEIQKLKQNSRHLKMIFLIGGVVMFMILIITICIFAGMWIRFGRNLTHVQKSTLGSQGSFRKCSQETTACNFTARCSEENLMKGRLITIITHYYH